MPDTKSPEVPSRARRHFLGLAATAGARVAALGVLASTALSSSAKADNTNNHPGWEIGTGNPHGSPACFLRGTAILTPTGEVPVEELRIGDLVETVRGEALPIKWIGHRVYKKSNSAWPPSVMPIRIMSGALDDHAPHKDLYLSPLHALFLNGVLIAVKELVNGTSIAPTLPDHQAEIEYFQLLLASHEVILVEGAAAETFLPRGRNHESFSNFTEYERLYPNEPWPVLAPFAPLVSYSGRAHLKALLRLGISPFVQRQDPVEDVYENTYERLAARAEELAS